MQEKANRFRGRILSLQLAGSANVSVEAALGKFLSKVFARERERERERERGARRERRPGLGVHLGNAEISVRFWAV